MDEEIESIAARVRMCQEKGPDAAYNDLPGNPGGRYIDDCGDLVSAYLAEHPADDQLPVDSQWMNSLDGWRASVDIGEHQVWSFVREDPEDFFMLHIEARRTGKNFVFRLNSGFGVKNPTRGDVRRLARALKIDLKEGQ